MTTEEIHAERQSSQCFLPGVHMTTILLLALALLLSGCTIPPGRPLGGQPGGPVQGPQNPVCFNRDGNFSIERTAWYAPYTPDLGDCGAER